MLAPIFAKATKFIEKDDESYYLDPHLSSNIKAVTENSISIDTVNARLVMDMDYANYCLNPGIPSTSMA